MNPSDHIYIAGHRGMVGSAILRLLEKKGYNNICTASKEELDLRDSEQVETFFHKNKPDYVFLAAAKVGGIQANIDDPVAFLSDNIMIQNNIITQCFLNKVKKILYLGSSCIYPKECPQPMKEESLLTGPLEPTNEGYALAKIIGFKLLQYYNRQYGMSFVSPMPCNLYGPGDSFDLKTSHVLSALVKRFVDSVNENKNEVELFGSGIARREFMHVDDLAEACLILMQNFSKPELINIGWGKDISIKELAYLVAEKANYKGLIKFDHSKPDGMLRKCLDIQKMHEIGFKPKIGLDEGISQMIRIYNSGLENCNDLNHTPCPTIKK